MHDVIKDMKVHFLTFGDGNRLRRSAAIRLATQSMSTRWFTSVTAAGLGTIYQLNTNFIHNHLEFISTNQRGFGYWIWKPFLIWQMPLNVSHGDIVLYCDSGCELNVFGRPRFEYYLQQTQEYRIFAFEINQHHRLPIERKAEA